MKIKTLKEYLNSDIEFYQYDNENFLDFLSAVKFKLNIPFIHVTGTSGKTIVGKILENIYSSNGYKVGFIDSEEMLNFDESNKKYSGFAEIFEDNWKIINKYELTKYEVLFYLSLINFKNEGKELLIFETFMGGYFDTSNIEETPLVSVINNVGLEHCDVLGKSVSEIAYTKCGIIKPDSLVVLNAFDADIDFVVTEECKKNKCKLVKVAEFYNYNLIDLDHLEIQYFPFPNFKVSTKALYNRENVACALEVINLLNNQFPCTNENIQIGLLKDNGYGYFDIFKIDGKIVVCDKANNPFSTEKLCKSLEFSLEDTIEHSAILFAVDYDKNLEKMLSILSRVSHQIILTTFNDDNARDENGFYLFLEDYSYVDDCKEAFASLIADENVKNIIITGNEKFVKLFERYLGDDR